MSWISTMLGMRVLQSSLWEITMAKVNLSLDVDNWVDQYFPPARPCLNLTLTQGKTEVVVTSSVASLCAPSPSQTVSHLRYKGVPCEVNGASGILWTNMTTLDPRAGLKPSECAWQAQGEPKHWQELYTGACRVGPQLVPSLPQQYCE